MGCVFQNINVTSCFDLQSSSNRILFFEISHRCDPRGLCQEDVLGNPSVELLKLTDPWESLAGWHEGCFARAWL